MSINFVSVECEQNKKNILNEKMFKTFETILIIFKYF